MKEKVALLLNDSIKNLNVFVSDSFISMEEGKKIFNVVLDSDRVIDLNLITEASRIINKILDMNEEILDNCDVVDIYSKEKGDM